MKSIVLKLLASLLPIKTYLQLVFYYKTGYCLNITTPKTFNEIMQWRKLYSFDDFHTTLADKIKVRDFVSNKVGNNFLIPLICTLSDPESIDLANLPDSFVIKTNHNSGGIRIVKHKNLIDKKELVSFFRSQLSLNYFSITKEPQYRNILPSILIEALLIDKNNQAPHDYKFHCFNGKVEFIQVDIDRFTNHARNFYDSNWSKLPFIWCPWKNGRPKYPNGRDIDKPKNLNSMISIAEKLAQDFDYIRVDLYNVDGRIYFGELTFHQGSGWERFSPKEYDLKYGQLLLAGNSR